MKTKIEKKTVFTVLGAQFYTIEEAEAHLKYEETRSIYDAVENMANYITSTDELMDFIGNLSNKELAIIRQIVHTAHKNKG